VKELTILTGAVISINIRGTNGKRIKFSNKNLSRSNKES
jgi:hypothetical protein